MRVRLAELAAQAGVSEATVSRVLNDKPTVAESTRRAVLTAIDALGYERPVQLRPRRSGLVGLIVPELENPVFPQFAQVIETALARNGFTPVLCTQVAGGIHEDDYVRMLLDQSVCGIIFVCGIHAVADTDPVRYRTLREGGLPIVLLNGYLNGVDAPFISTDDVAASEMAVEHLVGLGHQRIGLAVGPRRYTSVERRIAGFEAAMRRSAAAMNTEDLAALVECTVFRIEGGASATHALLDRGATAIVCGSDLMALGAIQAARQRGLRVPEDVSVVGSDDNLLMAFIDPPLTTVRQPVPAMGAAAVQALVADLSGTMAPRAEYVFRPELIVRDSTAPRRR